MIERPVPYIIFLEDEEEDQRQLEAFRANPPHFLTVSAKD